MKDCPENTALGNFMLDTTISDHLPVYAVLNMKLPKPPPQHILTQSYKNYDGERFAAHLADQNRKSLFPSFRTPM
jgi:hypothetical protein